MKSLKLLLLILIVSSAPIYPQNGGYAVKFNGTSGYATGTINPGTSSSTATLEAWFTTESITAGTVIIADLHSLSGANDRRRVLPYLDSGVISIMAAPNVDNDANAINQSTGITITPNAWYHIAVTINGTTLKMYVNGKLYITANLTDSYAMTGDDRLILGSHYWTTAYYNTKVDEARVWTTEKTGAQINANMFKELTGAEPGLLAYYKMSDGAGASISDNSTNGYNMTLNGGYTWIASSAFADPRGSLSFDGTDDYVDCGNGANVNFSGTQSFSIEAWVKPAAATWGSIISKFQHSATHEGYSLEMFSDYRVALLIGNNWSDWTNITSVNPLTVNTWNHVATTYDGSTIKLYINGRLEATAAWTNGITDSGTNLVVGARMGTLSFSTFFVGQIDEVRVWGDARTEAQLWETMLRPLVGTEAGLRAYYRFDEGAGASTYDLSSNAYTGTLVSSPVRSSESGYNVWVGSNSSTWSDGANWSKGSAPSSSQSAGIYKWNLGSEAAISTNPTVRNLLISAGSAPSLNSNITINCNLLLGRNFDLNGSDITLGTAAYLVEGTGILYGTTGSISTTRTLNNISSLNIANLGLQITTAANMGSTTIKRGHTAQSGNSNSSIERYYDVTPTNNSSLNATMVFNYYDSELNGLTENTLVLFKSTDSGTNWTAQGGTLNTGTNTVTKSGIASFSRWTLGSTAATLEGIPAAPVASAATGVSSTGFTANWAASAGATKYYLDVATNNTFTSMVTGYNDLDVGNVITYAVTGLNPGTNYYFRVRANNVSGTSGNSGTITVTTTLTAPVATAATSLLAASISANWNASAGATGYYLDVAKDAGFTLFVTGFNNLDVANVTTYNVTGLTGGTTYYYRVRAYTALVTTGNSNPITVLTVPAAPVAIDASNINTGDFTANWNSSAGAVAYYLDVATDLAFTSFVGDFNNRNAGGVTSLLVTPTTPNTAYYYRVRAANASGSSVSSNVIAINTLIETPVISNIETGGLTYTVKEGELKITDLLNIQASAACPLIQAEVKITSGYNADSDILEVKDPGQLTASWDRTSGTLTITGAGGASAYEAALRNVKYRSLNVTPPAGVRQLSFSVYNGTNYSNTLTRNLSVAGGNTAPAITGTGSAPLVYTKGVSPLRVILSETIEVADEDNYYLYSASVSIVQGYIKDEDFIDCNNTAFITGVFNADTGTLTITGKAPVAAYRSFLREVMYRNRQMANATTSQKAVCFTVFDGLANSGAAVRFLNVRALLETPAGLTGTASGNMIRLAWTDNSTAEQGYLIERSEGNNLAFIEIARAAANEVNYSDFNILNGRRYFYRVAAYSGNAKSDYSNEISVNAIVVGLSDRNGMPLDFAVGQNYPNPFNPSTTIIYGMPVEARVRVEIYNSVGQVVEVLADENKSAGYHTTVWNAKGVSSGAYFYKITAIGINGSTFSVVKRMLLLK